MVHFILKMFGAIEVDDSVGFPMATGQAVNVSTNVDVVLSHRIYNCLPWDLILKHFMRKTNTGPIKIKDI